jgi:hypothetical protein
LPPALLLRLPPALLLPLPPAFECWDDLPPAQAGLPRPWALFP